MGKKFDELLEAEQKLSPTPRCNALLNEYHSMEVKRLRVWALARALERESDARADALLQVSEHARRLEIAIAAAKNICNESLVTGSKDIDDWREDMGHILAGLRSVFQ